MRASPPSLAPGKPAWIQSYHDLDCVLGHERPHYKQYEIENGTPVLVLSIEPGFYDDTVLLPRGLVLEVDALDLRDEKP